jgi:hypothetical protein
MISIMATTTMTIMIKTVVTIMITIMATTTAATMLRTAATMTTTAATMIRTVVTMTTDIDREGYKGKEGGGAVGCLIGFPPMNQSISN